MVRRGFALALILLLGIPIAFNIKTVSERQVAIDDRPTRYHVVSYVAHEPFNITSDADFETQPWPGNGTASDPYMIQNLNITTDNSTCIWIMNTTSHCVIQNCYFVSQIWEYSLNQQIFPVTLSNVSNCRIIGNRVSNSSCGISGYALTNCSISGNQFNVTWIGIELRSSNLTTVVNNSQESDQCFYGLTIDRCHDCNISLNRFRQVKSHGVSAHANFNTNITDNVFEASNSEMYFPWVGIDLWGGEYCVISNNKVSGFENSGIEVYGTHHLIENNTIISNQKGIFLHANSSILRENILADNFNAIEITATNDSAIYDNVVTGAQRTYDSGIEIHGGSDCEIYENQIWQVAYGIILQGATHFNISSNQVTESRYGFVFNWYGSPYMGVPSGPAFDCDIINNSFDRGGVYPIIEHYESWDFGRIRFDDNTVNGRLIGFYAYLEFAPLVEPEYGQLFLVSCRGTGIFGCEFYGVVSDVYFGEYHDPGQASAIILLNCSECIFQDIRFHDNTIGVTLQSSTDCVFTGITAYRNSWGGIIFWQCGDITITDGFFGNNRKAIGCQNSWSCEINSCTFRMNTEAIILAICPNFTIANNEIYQNADAVILISSDRSEVFYNEIYLNTRGLLLNSSSNCLITLNEISDNSGVGVCLDLTAHMNHIYLNTFTNNSPNAICEGQSNHWDNEVDTGNRWDDYSGEGPYIIDEDDQDNYPIVDLEPTTPATGGPWFVDPMVLLTAGGIVCFVALLIIARDIRRVEIID